MEYFNEFNTKGTIPSRSTSDIISHAFELYKSIFGYAILAMILYFIASMFLQPISGYDQNQAMEEIMNNPNGYGFSDYVNTPGFYSYSGLSVIFGLLMTPLFVSIIYMTHCVNSRKEIKFDQLFFVYKNRFLNVVIYSLITNIILTISLLFCVLPVFLVFPLIFIGYPIILFENTSAIEALSKSFKIAKENYGTFIGVSLLSILISLSGILLCGFGIIATALFSMSASYSLYIAFVGKPGEVVN